ncbi:MAG: hypothetical protein HDS37_06490 [Bacteroides sp.]|nr:hypothetical protein [Bacteroides sp.]
MKKFLLTLAAAMMTASSFAAFNVPAKSNGSVKPGVPSSTSKKFGTLQAPAVANRSGMMKAEGNDFGAITEVPAGKEVKMLGSSQTFYLDYDEVCMDEAFGLAYEAVFTDGGDVYLKNPISMLDWDTYIKGKETEDGITFEFPQPLFRSAYEDETFDLYVDVLEYTEIEAPNFPGYYYPTFVPAETRTITFIKNEDGSYAMDCEYMMGVTCDDLWQGYGEMYLSLLPFEEKQKEIPEGIDYDYSYVLVDEVNGWDHSILRLIGIGELNGETYISGLFSGMPDAVVYGTFDKETNQLTVPSDQFLGKFYNRYIFMMAGTGYTYYDESWESDMYSFDTTQEPLVFNYDPETNTYTPVITEGNDFAYIIFNFGNTETYPCEYYAVDKIYSQGKITDYAPVTPEIEFVNEISFFDPDYSYAVEFYIYGENNEGKMLREDHIFYNIYINGELYTFTSEEYPTLLDQGVSELTDIPVDFNAGDDFYAYGSYHGVALKRKDVETIGIRAVYIDGEIRAESDIMTVNTLGEPLSAASLNQPYAKGTETFDINGRKVSESNGTGILIRRTTLSDGSIRTEKVIKK